MLHSFTAMHVANEVLISHGGYGEFHRFPSRWRVLVLVPLSRGTNYSILCPYSPKCSHLGKGPEQVPADGLTPVDADASNGLPLRRAEWLCSLVLLLFL